MKPRFMTPPLRLILVSLAVLLGAPMFAAAAEPPANSRPANPTAHAWKWTTLGRNGQPEESVLKLVTAPNGAVSGTLTNRSGVHPVNNIKVRGNRIEFVVERATPNGRVALAHTLTDENGTTKITVERPDSTPKGRKTGARHKVEANAFKLPDEPASSLGK